MPVSAVTDENFESEVLKSEIPVLVDFWAEWCGPCKALAPVFEEISENRDDVKFVKVNVDENTKISAKYGIRSIPSLILFVNGVVKDTKVGVLTKSQIQQFLDNQL